MVRKILATRSHLHTIRCSVPVVVCNPRIMDASDFSVERSEQFEEVCSKDFLEFKFGGRGYQDQLNESIAKTQALAAVKVEHVTVKYGDVIQEIVWVTHNFGFLGGSLGCAEGEKITRAFEYALEKQLPVCVQVYYLYLVVSQ